MTTRAALTVTSALATAFAAVCLGTLVTPVNWVLGAFLMTGVVAGTGALLRRSAVHRALIAPIQLLLGCYLLLLAFVQPSLTFGVLPGPQAFGAVGSLLVEGGDTIQRYTVPAPASDGLRLILVGAVTLVAVLVDLLAVTLRQAAAAGLPLLAVYSVGTGLSGGRGGTWFWFLLGGAGYLLLLNADGRDRISRWGRVFHGSSASGKAPGSGGRVGLIALAIALLLPVFVPQADFGLLDGGSGGVGPGGGNGLTSLNPVVALTANLNRTSSVEMLQYSVPGDSGDSTYLRIGALDGFDGVEWKFQPTAVGPLPNPMPRPPELSPSVEADQTRTQVQISKHLSTNWLPLPYPATRISDLGGHWQYDHASRTVLGDGATRATGLSYDVDSLTVKPTEQQLRNAPGPDDDLKARYTFLPRDLPVEVQQTAQQVTKGQRTAYDQAMALQDWFSRSGGFQYSLKVDAGTGSLAITKFLHDKTGFCVHFAATMAAMARSLGIPARVAIGFAPGQEVGKGVRVVHSSDYHAWPELYFSGVGWMRFEPTPGVGRLPDYGQQAAPAPTATTAQPSASASDGNSAGPSAGSSCAGGPGGRRLQDDCGNQQSTAAPKVKHTPWWLSATAFGWYTGVLLVLALLAVPMLWRIRLRRRRLGVGRRRPGGRGGDSGGGEVQVLAAWQELIDTAWDLGIPPDEAQTPRHTVRRIAEAGGLDPVATAAAGRVALATEQVLYARAGELRAPLGPDVRTAGQGLRAGAGRRRRLLAVVLPASTIRLWWRATDRAHAARDAVTDRLGALRARLTREK